MGGFVVPNVGRLVIMSLATGLEKPVNRAGVKLSIRINEW